MLCNEKFISYKVINGHPHYGVKGTNELRNRLNGYVSFYQGAPSYVFPERIEKIVKCPMSKYQYESYNIKNIRLARASLVLKSQYL